MQGRAETILSSLTSDADLADINDDTAPDYELLLRIKAGNRPAFDIIYKRYWKSLYNLAFNLFRERLVCEDIVQDVFFQLWIKRETLQIHTLQLYLFSSVRHGALRAIKEKRAVVDVTSVQELLSSQRQSDFELRERDLTEQVSSALSELPDKCREIFLMSRHHALPVAQIARQLEISPKTVENQITIALKRLRNSLSDYFVIMLLASLL